jgi:radical SAM protein with 4Fe4S-binding SPASM domain
MVEISPTFNKERLNLSSQVPLATPLVVYVEPSSYCNLECKFCPQHIDPDSLVKKNMSLEMFSKLIDDLSKFPSKLKLIRFCGTGDSTMNKSFGDMVKIAAKADVAERLELVTNGLLLRPKLADVVTKYLDRIIVSIEGLSAEDYFKYTLRKMNFEKFLEQLCYVKDIDNRRTKLHIKIHNSAVQTEERKKHFFEVFSDIADEIYIENLVNLWPEVESNLGMKDMHRFFSDTPREMKVCPQIFKSMQVNSDGKVIPCCIDFKGINNLGNLEREGLKEIWNGETMRDLRVKHLRGERHEFSPCKGCSMNEYADTDTLDESAKEILKRI